MGPGTLLFVPMWEAVRLLMVLVLLLPMSVRLLLLRMLMVSVLSYSRSRVPAWTGILADAQPAGRGCQGGVALVGVRQRAASVRGYDEGGEGAQSDVTDNDENHTSSFLDDTGEGRLRPSGTRRRAGGAGRSRRPRRCGRDGDDGVR